MSPKDHCSILTVTPYRLLPPVAGGHISILNMHHHLGKLCPDHMVSTKDNDSSDAWSFDMHRVFAPNPGRYLPYAYQKTLKSLARKYDISAIMCEHPYMAISVHSLARSLKLPWFLRSHNIESERFRSLGKPWWRVLAKYEQWAMRAANGVLFVTDEDSVWAQQHYYLDASRCYFVPYGTHLSERPQGHAEAKQKLSELWNIPTEKHWIYFIGALDYKPNHEAVAYILDEIAPRLRQSGLNYQLLIGGKSMAPELQERINTTEDIRYTGFIPDLDEFLKACDVMINPVLTGGGVKTKAVEALAYNKIVVSPFSGSAGLARNVSGSNLLISADHDWDTFCKDIVMATGMEADISKEFYGFYYWGNIAKQVLGIVHR
jgi:glycosyltransferase involved in cell wall biosynthesis